MAAPLTGSGSDGVPHRHFDKLVAAAYLRMMGATQREAGRSVGASEETVRKWEKHPAWPRARERAKSLWMSDVEDASRSAVLKSVRGGNADLGLSLLERLDPRLAPPTRQMEVQHAGLLGVIHRLSQLSDEDLTKMERLDDAALADLLAPGEDDGDA